MADTIITGKILTGIPEQPQVEAAAIRDGKILAIGTAMELEVYHRSSSEFVECDSGIVIPGIPREVFEGDADLKTYLDMTAKLLTDGGGIENTFGKMTVGSEADLIWLDRDVTELSSEEIEQTKVRQLWIDGRSVYKSE